MASLLNAIFGNDVTNMNNEVIANDMLAGSKTAAVTYLNATLECATPELRRLYMQYCNQAVQSHESITALAVQRNWYKPYEDPVIQLSETYKQSSSVNNQSTQ